MPQKKYGARNARYNRDFWRQGLSENEVAFVHQYFGGDCEVCGAIDIRVAVTESLPAAGKGAQLTCFVAECARVEPTEGVDVAAVNRIESADVDLFALLKSMTSSTLQLSVMAYIYILPIAANQRVVAGAAIRSKTAIAQLEPTAIAATILFSHQK